LKKVGRLPLHGNPLWKTLLKDISKNKSVKYQT